ncbi:MAG: MBL fold metallo-hydrolase [Pseudomonadota bacterium]
MTPATSDRLILLGTKGGPAIRHGGAMPTSSMIDYAGRLFVFDCGLGVTRGLVEAGISLKRLDHIFVTHLHSDHVLELGPLIHTAWTTGLDTPVTVFGAAGTAAYWEAFLESMSFDIGIRVEDEGRTPLDQLVTVKPLSEGRVCATADLTVDALRVDHPPVEHCFALRISTAACTVVLSSDTAYFPPLGHFAKGADIIVHEAILPGCIDALVAKTGLGEKLRAHLLASHTTASDAGRIAASSGAGTLVLNHLIPSDDPAFTHADWEREVRRTWQGNLIIGHDGLVLPLNGGPLSGGSSG